MHLSLDDIIKAHYHEFQEISVSPDVGEVLVVFGNYDLPSDDYRVDIKNRSIWRIRLSDGLRIQLAGPQEDAHTPCWSPDGNKIAYLSRLSGQTEIWMMNRDGSDPRQLTTSDCSVRNSFDNSTLCWSPDGLSIAYTTVPNGSYNELQRLAISTEDNEKIEVSGPGKGQEKFGPNLTNRFECSLNIISTASEQIRPLIHGSKDRLRIISWLQDPSQLLVQINAEIKAIDVATGDLSSLYTGPFNLGHSLVHVSPAGIFLACLSGQQVEVGLVVEGLFKLDQSIDLEGNEITLDAWSYDGTRLFGTTREGVSTFLFVVDLGAKTVHRLTQTGKAVSPLATKCLQDGSVVFPQQGPTEPAELWQWKPDMRPQKISKFNKGTRGLQLPEVKIIQYSSNSWTIEALLVLPVDYSPGAKYPTLVYLHGGPESYVGASFTDLISARAESAAHFLATQGYAVLLPNFRGSSGYGIDFEYELRVVV